MYPNRSSYGGSRRGPGFTGTFVTGRGPSQNSRFPGSRREEPPRQPSRSGAPAQHGGMTTIVRPGEPHYFGTRLDRQNALVVNPLCRCQDPASHGNAWAFADNEPHGFDMNQRPMLWAELANKALDHYGRSQITREEEWEAYRHIMHPGYYRGAKDHYHHLNRVVGRGGHVYISPYPEDLQFHNADGHAQNNITEGGLRTHFNPTGGRGGSHFGADRGFGSRR